jgi:hypothetical protein
MADDEKNLEKAQKDQRDIGAEEDPHSTGPAENLREEAAENLREEAAEMVDQDDKSRDSMSPQNKAEHEPTAVKRDLDNPEIVEKRKSVTGILAGRPIVILLIIGAIVLGGFLLYTQIQYSNQAYKIENFNALWNQSLADLRSGNTSIDEYCINRVHDEDLCNRFKNLQYMD